MPEETATEKETLEEKITPLGMQVRLIEEQHQVVHRQAAPAEEQTVCCREFEAEYGRNFRLLPHGGVVPESVAIRRIRLGRETYGHPQVPWNYCPCCGLPIQVHTDVVAKTITV